MKKYFLTMILLSFGNTKLTKLNKAIALLENTTQETPISVFKIGENGKEERILLTLTDLQEMYASIDTKIDLTKIHTNNCNFFIDDYQELIKNQILPLAAQILTLRLSLAMHIVWFEKRLKYSLKAKIIPMLLKLAHFLKDNIVELEPANYEERYTYYYKTNNCLNQTNLPGMVYEEDLLWTYPCEENMKDFNQPKILVRDLLNSLIVNRYFTKKHIHYSSSKYDFCVNQKFKVIMNDLENNKKGLLLTNYDRTEKIIDLFCALVQNSLTREIHLVKILLDPILLASDDTVRLLEYEIFNKIDTCAYHIPKKQISSLARESFSANDKLLQQAFDASLNYKDA